MIQERIIYEFGKVPVGEMVLYTSRNLVIWTGTKGVNVPGSDRLDDTYQLINPNAVFLPHVYDLSPGSLSSKKVQRLVESFIAKGYDLERPPAVGYPVEGKIQIIDGGHRALAAARAGILLPIIMRTRKEVMAIKGTPKEPTFGHTTTPLKNLRLVK